MNPATAKLTPASGLPGFERLEEASRVVAAFPAHPGWRQRFWEKDDDESSAFDVLIVGWLVDENGNLTPVAASQESYLEPSTRQRSEILAPTQEPDASTG